jgi:hypothetical protein
MVYLHPYSPSKKKLVKKAIDSDRAELTPCIPHDASHTIEIETKAIPKLIEKMKTAPQLRMQMSVAGRMAEEADQNPPSPHFFLNSSFCSLFIQWLPSQ